MAATKTKQKRGQHGGRRNGSGRRPLPGGPASVVTVRLSGAHKLKVERWQKEARCSTFSEALRAMIDAAMP